MSHFSLVQTKLIDRECLVAALQELHLQPQVYEQPHLLKGYYGSQSEYSAEIVVPASTIKARADIGFKWDEAAGFYNIIHDDYETIPRLGRDFFSHKLMEKYGMRVIYAKAAELSERLGECTIAESRTSTQQTLRLVFAAHQQVSSHSRR